MLMIINETAKVNIQIDQESMQELIKHLVDY